MESNIVTEGNIIPHWHQWIDFQTENQQGNSSLKQHIKPDGFNDIFRSFHLKAAEYTFSSNAHGTFSRIDHMLGRTQKKSINSRRLKLYRALLWQQWYKTRNQLQEIKLKNTQIHEAKYHDTEQWMGQKMR